MTSRQRKVLAFFGVETPPDLSIGAANWEIGNLFADTEKRALWRRYVYATGDLDDHTDELRPFNRDELHQLELPEDWSVTVARQQYRDEIVADILSHGAPFDHPAPLVEFEGRSFLFTGRFTFGQRRDCELAVTERGGRALSQKRPTAETDYLVIGTKGSPHWKRGHYGIKIESGLIIRRETAGLAIISEEHWHSFL